MATQRKKKAKGLPKRTGKRKDRRARYYATRFLSNKLHRILARNGLAAARIWAQAHLADGILNRMLREKGIVESVRLDEEAPR